MGTFDVLLTNPPFGSKIVAASEDVQGTFDLGYKWTREEGGAFNKTPTLQSSVPPQVLFVERCLKLVRPGGRIGMVVPESLISSKSHRYVVNYMLDNATLRAVVGMPESLFKTSGKSGTHTKTCLIFLEKRAPRTRAKASPAIFMAEPQWCGRDSRGRTIDRDDLPLVRDQLVRFRDGKLRGHSHLGYAIAPEAISDHVLAPRYYDPEVQATLERLATSHDLLRIGDLVSSGVLEITTGDEIGKLAYGGGDIPFVRTSDLSNWEVKIDPKHCVSDETYEQYARKQDVRDGDILMVRDGTYLIGTCAYVTRYDTRMVFQSHIYKIRVLDKARLSPYLLLAGLSSSPVQRQIKAKRFTQDIIDSLGDRIGELVLPIPRSDTRKERVARTVEKVIQDRIEARELARQACSDIVAPPS